MVGRPGTVFGSPDLARFACRWPLLHVCYGREARFAASGYIFVVASVQPNLSLQTGPGAKHGPEQASAQRLVSDKTTWFLRST